MSEQVQKSNTLGPGQKSPPPNNEKSPADQDPEAAFLAACSIIGEFLLEDFE